MMEEYLDDQLNDADDELAELQDKYAFPPLPPWFAARISSNPRNNHA